TALATGGTAVGATRTKSRPSSCALRKAAEVGMTSVVPSGKTARTSRARMDSFTFSLRFCLRGGKFLPGYIGYTFVGRLERHKDRGWEPRRTLWLRIGMRRSEYKLKVSSVPVYTKTGTDKTDMNFRRSLPAIRCQSC